MNKRWDAIWFNGTLLTCENGYGLIKNAAIAVKAGKIAWLGELVALEDDPQNLAENCCDLKGRLLSPGFIDSHTHVVYAGNRAHEFALRLQGATYEKIAKLGGGIFSTVSKTRLATEEELLKQSIKRVECMLANGVTTVEIKSGYGLDWENELKILRVIKRIENLLPITVYKTFLGAHTIPPEFSKNPDVYVDLVCNEMIPQVAEEKLADAVDVFCETIAFSLSQTERVFQTAQQFGLAIKCHAEQLSKTGASKLAAKYHALSVDHLEYETEEGIKAIAESGTVATLLPGAFYFLREKKLPPVDLLRQYKVPIAIATDCNPGTSPILSLLTILNMACILFHLTPEEALLGVTKNAAMSLGLKHSHGTLAVGKVADFAIWDVEDFLEIIYYLGSKPLWQLVKAGKVIL